ncbi:MAG: L,D-transpeptidase family protein [Planctomycetota bacterium]|nr:L,D-transpeptidase family protein [Planctomycetota bacterium]
MRTTILFLIIGCGIWWGYNSWVAGESDDTTTTEVTNAAAGSQEPIAPESVNQPDNPETALQQYEIQSLRKQLAADPDDGTRILLANALLATGEASKRGEALGILGSMEKSDRELSGTARAVLMRESDGQQRSAFAHKIIENGSQSPGYGESCFLVAEEVGFLDDSSAARSWKLLSAAYNSSDENSWRQPIRMRLRDLVEQWVLSHRSFSMCNGATVVSGDSLHKIAKQNRISVDSLRLLNNVRGNTIHPGQKLKFLGGQVHAEIDKSDFWIDVFIDGYWLLGYPIGHGKNNCTPSGEFSVDILQKKPMWQPRDGRAPIEYGQEGNPLGERWIGFKDGAQHFGLGIHGTADPESIGSQASEGCIRLRNEDVVQIYPWMNSGAKVYVRE